MAQVSIIIVNYNSGDRLARCLEAAARQTFQDFELIVIDNASTDDSMRTARAAAPSAAFIEAGSNLGFAAANNLAAKTVRSEWIAFLNPDAYAEPEWLSELIAASRRHPWADAFGSTQIDAADPARLDGAGDVYHVFGIPYRGHFGWPTESLPSEGECFAPCAAAALYRASVFRALGGFDETFFCYGEDVDLGFRLRLAGGRAVQVASAIVRHEGSGISGRYSPFTVYHGNRNRIWTLYKNMPAALLWPLLPFQLAANGYLLLRSFSVGIGRPYWRAMVDGYGGLPKVFAVRSRVQAGRKARLADIARVLAWSPLKVSRREARLLPIQPA